MTTSVGVISFSTPPLGWVVVCLIIVIDLYSPQMLLFVRQQRLSLVLAFASCPEPRWNNSPVLSLKPLVTLFIPAMSTFNDVLSIYVAGRLTVTASILLMKQCAHLKTWCRRGTTRYKILIKGVEIQSAHSLGRFTVHTFLTQLKISLTYFIFIYFHFSTVKKIWQNLK